MRNFRDTRKRMRAIKKLFPQTHYCRRWEGNVLEIIRWYYWLGWSFGMTKIPFTMVKSDREHLMLSAG